MRTHFAIGILLGLFLVASGAAVYFYLEVRCRDSVISQFNADLENARFVIEQKDRTIKFEESRYNGLADAYAARPVIREVHTQTDYVPYIAEIRYR